MTRTDMSPKAVTARLVRTSQLRRLCLELGRQRDSRTEAPAQRGHATNPTAECRGARGDEDARGAEERLED